MKKTIYSLLLAGLSIPLHCAASAEQKNLVKNGDFEDGTAGWRGDVNIVFETPEETNKVCRIEVDKERSVKFYQEINIWKMEYVKVKLRVHASADFVQEKNRAGCFVGLGSHGSGKPLKTGWNEMEYTLDNRDDEDRLDLYISVERGRSGTLSFDDIEVVEYVKPPAVKKVEPADAPLPSIVDEYHAFIDKSGRTIQAKIINVDSEGANVTLQREGSHRSATVPVTLFDDDTQAYIRSWIEASDFLNERILPVEFNHKYEKIADQSQAYTGGITTTSWSKSSVYYGHHIEMIIQNKSKHPFNNVTLEYTLFYSQDHAGREGKKTERAGTLYYKQNIDIPPRSTKEIASEQIILHSYSYVSRSYSPEDRDGELEGIIIHLSLLTETGETVTREIIYPEKKDFTWTTKTRNVQERIPRAP